MRDLDDLLNGDVAGAARRSVNPPDFASVRALGHRRRLVVWEAIGGACATAVVAVVTAWNLGVSSTGSPPPDVVVRPSEPDPAPTDRAGLRAERIINDPDAQVVGLSVSPGDPDVRASVWMLCATDRCHDQEYAVAVTEDGYTSHAAVALPARDQPVLTAAGPAAFYVDVPGGPDVLVGGDGRQIPIEASGDTRPLSAGEMLAPHPRSATPQPSPPSPRRGGSAAVVASYAAAAGCRPQPGQSGCRPQPVSPRPCPPTCVVHVFDCRSCRLACWVWSR